MTRAPLNGLRIAGALLLLVVGIVHVQQYADFIKDVPTIGPLFMLTGFSAGVLCVLLATRARTLAALGGIGLCGGSLASITIARYASSGLFNYREPTLRTPVLIAVIAELLGIGVLALYAARSRTSAPALVTA